MCTSESRIESPLSKLKENPHPVKIEVTEKTPIGVILVVTLIRTETTLDHSQKAEKVRLVAVVRYGALLSSEKVCAWLVATKNHSAVQQLKKVNSVGFVFNKKLIFPFIKKSEKNLNVSNTSRFFNIFIYIYNIYTYTYIGWAGGGALKRDSARWKDRSSDKKRGHFEQNRLSYWYL